MEIVIEDVGVTMVRAKHMLFVAVSPLIKARVACFGGFPLLYHKFPGSFLAMLV